LPAELGKNGLNVLSLLTGTPTKIRVSGISMLPFMEEGDEVEVVAAKKKDFNAGDLIVFNRDGDLIVHRIIRKKAESFLEMGDNQRLGVWQEWQEHVGRVVSIVKKDGSLIGMDEEIRQDINKRTARLQSIRNLRSVFENKTRFYSMKRIISLPFRFLEFLMGRTCPL
jgi:hypothetical protein